MSSLQSYRSDRRRSINDIDLPPNVVKGLSIEMLKELNAQDEATFYQFFEGLQLEEVKKARERSQQIREENKLIALKNLELKPKFEELKTQLIERSSVLGSLKEEYDKGILELKGIQNKTNHQAIEKELSQIARKTEQDSEDMASEFIGGKSTLSLEDFQEDFIKQRTLYWLRRVKSEKMKELLQNSRPIPAPRKAHTSASALPAANVATTNPPPVQSLPPQHAHPSSSPGYPSEPTASLPPYPSRPVMPMPQQHQAGPFPAAAYTSYRNPAPPVARPPSNPVPPVPRPQPYGGHGYNRFNQHRY